VCSRARARLVRDHICLGGKDWALGSVGKGIGVSVGENTDWIETFAPSFILVCNKLLNL